MRPNQTGRASLVPSAARWLYRFLSRDDSHSPEIVRAVAETIGISKRTLQRAKTALGVIKSQGSWHLPTDAWERLEELKRCEYSWQISLDDLDTDCHGI